MVYIFTAIASFLIGVAFTLKIVTEVLKKYMEE